MKRIFDIIFSLLGLLILSPLGVLIAILIRIESPGPVFFNQSRIGLNQIPFKLHKFRTMYINSENLGQLTVGANDERITRIGYWLRKFKIDELPQLWNVFIGDMSLVGPRPEVRKYVELYSEQQRTILSVRPGITDWASVKFRNENDLIVAAENPEEYYISHIMPAKLSMNLEYIERMNLWIDFKIILLTLFPFLKSRTIRKMTNKRNINSTPDLPLVK